MTTTHDYRDRYWGHDYAILTVNGMTIHLAGWGFGISAGDYILLTHSKGEARYQIDTIRYDGDPPDMWYADATFAPRTTEK